VLLPNKVGPIYGWRFAGLGNALPITVECEKSFPFMPFEVG